MFFIVGRGRSGTTLLATMLNHNRKIFIQKEGLFIVSLFEKYSTKKFDSKVWGEFVLDVFREDKMKNWGILPEDVLRCSKKIGTPGSFKEACIRIYETKLLISGVDSGEVLVGDKNPHYSLYLNVLSDVFPDAKFIWMVRDYRDNILSYKNVWFDLKNAGGLACRWKIFNQKIYNSSRLIATDRILIVKYEDLITSTSGTLERIYNFLNVTHKDEDLIYQPEGNVNCIWHAKLRSKVDHNNLDKWRNQLSKKEIEIADYICSDFAKLLGYKSEVDTISISMIIRGNLAKLAALIYTIMEVLFLKIPDQRKFLISNFIRSRLQKSS